MKQWFVLVTGVALASCAPSSSGERTLSSDGSPSVTLLDSTVLAEPDSLPLGEFVSVAVDGRGRIYLTNGGEGMQILRYSRNGDFEGAWGRRGSGPGEYQGPSMVYPFPGDTIGAIVDAPTGRFTVVDLDNGVVREEFRAPFQATGKQWFVTDSTATFSLPLNSAIVGIWHLGQDSVTMIGALPNELMSAFPTYAQYGHLEIVPWRGGYLAQVPTLAALLQLDSSGAVVGEVTLPAVRRRGQTDDLLLRQQQQEADGSSFTHLGSVAATLGVLSSGEVAAIQVDIDTEQTDQRREFGNLRYYVSILSSDLTRACLDALVPFTSDVPFPIPHLMGDTLVALTRVVGADDTVRTVVYRFGISSKGCTWVTL